MVCNEKEGANKKISDHLKHGNKFFIWLMKAAEGLPWHKANRVYDWSNSLSLFCKTKKRRNVLKPDISGESFQILFSQYAFFVAEFWRTMFQLQNWKSLNTFENI